jgi:3-deoxy-manno-octulosonate cytidylyltransferase (CMP-KDO synthetase)
MASQGSPLDLSTIAIIPARYQASRLPGKPLADIGGKPMIRWVYECALGASRLDRVLVATDDERVVAAVRGFGGEAVLTSSAHPSGTDRVAEVASGLDAAIVVNVQGDEPLLDPTAIDAALEPLLADPTLPMSTLSVPIRRPQDMLAASVVKVVVDGRGDALYFSRSPVPFVREGASGDLAAAAARAIALDLARKHVGLYAYRREVLLRLASLPPAPLESAEGLEQLRALHHGVRIRVVPFGGREGVAVDTPADLERVRALLGGPSPG